LATISVCSGVSLQATASKRAQNSASATATVAPADQQRHETRSHRAEKRRRIGRRVVEEHQDAVAALQPERLEAVPPLRSLTAQFGIAARARRPGQRHPLTAAMDKIIEQDAAGVVAFRNGKSDFARAGIIPGYLIVDHYGRLPLLFAAS
jgi:hypothetical protein